MDLVTGILQLHAAMHARELTGQVYRAQGVFDLPDDQMRRRPGAGLNSLVWLLWHMARTEDAAVNPVVAGRDQVLDDGWMRRMNVPWRIIGTGMTDDEVAELSARADVAAVRDYRLAVGRRTREVARSLSACAWEEILGPADIRRGGVAGAFRDWVDGADYPWIGRGRGEQLASSATLHNAAHVGEAVTVRGLLGIGF
jgi:hypothetical protein